MRKRCPECDKNFSVGCKKIIAYLTKKSIPYSQEYSFDDLKDKIKLRFDFAIFNKDKSLFALIEFDGIQHFSTEKGFYGSSFEESQKELEYIQYHDSLKNKYCSENNIRLLRIRYDESVSKKLKLLFNDYPIGD